MQGGNYRKFNAEGVEIDDRESVEFTSDDVMWSANPLRGKNYSKIFENSKCVSFEKLNLQIFSQFSSWTHLHFKTRIYFHRYYMLVLSETQYTFWTFWFLVWEFWESNRDWSDQRNTQYWQERLLEELHKVVSRTLKIPRVFELLLCSILASFCDLEVL